MRGTRPYRFVTVWHLHAPREQVWDQIEGGLADDDPLPWWRAVEVTAVSADGYDLCARSAFGYRLRFSVRDLRLDRPDTMAFRSVGDLVGTGDLRFADAEEGTALTIVWDVVATPDWMRRWDRVLRPVFVVGHRLVMASGERRLNRWLDPRG